MLVACRNRHAAAVAGRCVPRVLRSRQITLHASHDPSFSTTSSRKLRITYTDGRSSDSRRHDQTDRGNRGDRRNREKGATLHLKTKAGFENALHARLAAIKEELSNSTIFGQIQSGLVGNGDKAESFNKAWRQFVSTLKTGGNERTAFFGPPTTKGDGLTPLQDLSKAYHLRGERGLDDRIKYAFYGHVTGARFSESDIRNQKALADLRYPTEWFPATRVLQREIHLHVGPTNSGKTYNALQRLEKATSGVYAGPLRLLAHEVYSRLNAKGVKCALITGEERRLPENVETGELFPMKSCTVEMMPLNTSVEVAVIDEIQMIGSEQRGWAWTQALLGIKAKEVHLCGEERAVPLIRELCASTGDKLEVHRYERLSPLQMADKSLRGDLKQLRKGDCIVSFSVMGIHALRRQIEKATGKKVATVYGSLPPETRAQQARLFNEPDNDYDYLVASDAVGMGLNLAIKRIIFESSSKFDGVARRPMSTADIKQIGGRAGRFRTAAQATQQHVSAEALAAAKGDTRVANSETLGLVTTLEDFDFPVVKEAMSAEPPPIKTAGLFPPGPVLERFASYFPPGTPFSYMLTRLHELSQMHKRFHLCGLKDQVWIADLIEPIEGLTITDRNVICAAPASKTDHDLWKELMPAYARVIAKQEQVDLVDIQELPLEILEMPGSASREYLRELERLHKSIVTYLWLSFRFAGIFGQRSLAMHVKSMVEDKIEAVLGKFSFTEAQRRLIASRREKQLLKGLEFGPASDASEEAEDASTHIAVGSLAIDDDPHDTGNREGAALKDEDLREQTSLTMGGDRFGGESDIEFEEPGEAEELIPDVEAEAQPLSAAKTDTKVLNGVRTSHEGDDGELARLKSADEQPSHGTDAMQPAATDKQGGVASAS